MAEKHGDNACMLARTQALLFAGGELPPEDVAEFEAHLRSCAECEQLLAQDARVRSVLQALPQVRVSGETLASLSRAASTFHAKTAGSAPGATRIVWMQHWRRWAWAVPLAATILAGVTLTTRRRPETPLPAPTITVVVPETKAQMSDTATLVAVPSAAKTAIVRVTPAPNGNAGAALVDETLGAEVADLAESVETLALVIDEETL